MTTTTTISPWTSNARRRRVNYNGSMNFRLQYLCLSGPRQEWEGNGVVWRWCYVWSSSLLRWWSWWRWQWWCFNRIGNLITCIWLYINTNNRTYKHTHTQWFKVLSTVRRAKYRRIPAIYLSLTLFPFLPFFSSSYLEASCLFRSVFIFISRERRRKTKTLVRFGIFSSTSLSK